MGPRGEIMGFEVLVAGFGVGCCSAQLWMFAAFAAALCDVAETFCVAALCAGALGAALRFGGDG